MHGHGTQDGSDEHARIERAIVLQLLRDDHDERWSHTELQATLGNIEPSTLTAALERLEQHGVVVAAAEHAVLASPCSRYLDELQLIAI
jgi:DNA-binding HxlR family transcriptional regulator